MFAEYQEGDLIAAADLQAYVVARSLVAKNFGGSNRALNGVFRFLIVPERLFAYNPTERIRCRCCG